MSSQLVSMPNILAMRGGGYAIDHNLSRPFLRSVGSGGVALRGCSIPSIVAEVLVFASRSFLEKTNPQSPGDSRNTPGDDFLQ